MSIDHKNIKSVFFAGVGGIGMSALARYFNMRGIKVTGYDKTETTLTQKLVEEGIHVHYEDDINLVPSDTELVVYTPALPKDHKQLNYCREKGLPVMKRAELLGLISRIQKTVAVAGTHGKTTTSSMVSHVLLECGEDISAFLGGIMSGYETNFFLGHGDYVVVEADEFDRSFLHLSPYIAAVNSIDPDHLDIYGTEDKVTESYIEFMKKTAEEGYLLMSESTINDLGTERVAELRQGRKVFSYGFEEGNDIFLQVRGVEEGRVVFDYFSPFGSIERVALKMPGLHNISNVSVAITVALLLGKTREDIVKAVESFKGIKRRFEIINEEDKVYIDDYAHHPTELQSAIAAARMMYPGKKILGIFQPHLFTRTRDFQDGFAAELSKLDEAVLMEIYPARELPIEGVNATMLLDKMTNEHKSLLDPEAILAKIEKGNFDVVMTLGAGNIDLLVPKIKAILAK
jgi:UDP-N-acetylmuramate--alanine ligase